jgi:hypothetical protein
MKQILVFGLLLSLLACGGTNVVKPPVVDQPFDVPALDTPLPGAVTSQGAVIGEADRSYLFGTSPPFGTVTGVKIIFSTIENTMPNAVSNTAYRVTFDPPTAVMVAPLDLYLNVDPEEVNLEDLVFGEQNADGSWQAVAPTLVPASAVPSVVAQANRILPRPLSQLRVIKIPVTKQGDYALASKFALLPRRASVRIGDQVNFVVSEITTDATNRASVAVVAVQSWSVNDTVGGSAALGLIAASSANKSTYSAPTKKPASGVVSVKAVANSKTFQSTVQILDSKGWVNIIANDYSKISFANSKGTYSETYGIALTGQYESAKASEYTPATNFMGNAYPEFLSHATFETKKEEGIVYLAYAKTVKADCICQDAKEVFTESYEYRGDLVPETNSTFVTAELTANQSKHTFSRGFRFRGPFKFSSSHIPCPGDTPNPSVNKDEIADGIAIVNVSGNDLHPKNRKFLRGAGQLKIAFSPPYAGTVKTRKRVSYYYADWFFPLIQKNLLDGQTQPQTPPVPTISPQFSPAIPQNPPQLRPQC